MKTITIAIGALENPLSVQLAGYISPGDAKQLDADNDAINRLYLGGYLSDSQTEHARAKLLKKTQAVCRSRRS